MEILREKCVCVCVKLWLSSRTPGVPDCTLTQVVDNIPSSAAALAARAHTRALPTGNASSRKHTITCGLLASRPHAHFRTFPGRTTPVGSCTSFPVPTNAHTHTLLLSSLRLSSAWRPHSAGRPTPRAHKPRLSARPRWRRRPRLRPSRPSWATPRRTRPRRSSW